jgi:hypothetical protein
VAGALRTAGSKARITCCVAFLMAMDEMTRIDGSEKLVALELDQLEWHKYCWSSWLRLCGVRSNTEPAAHI